MFLDYIYLLFSFLDKIPVVVGNLILALSDHFPLICGGFSDQFALEWLVFSLSWAFGYTPN